LLKKGRLDPISTGKLASAYRDYNEKGKTRTQRHPKTIYGKIFEGTIDYIFHN